ncbi:hypothetical protein M378DRAFT_914232 [Amanita muscaria Koide BX008]|uniref:Uncharacterized protein n=1 Tax=Amanita muscaria (strain Koide BX008) TaxID=946122 RepID=A0A0C2WW63_AMAMK|nr:hypothetical protein M378DRAFT_914232 [Amanita muscaria Koide BX008]
MRFTAIVCLTSLLLVPALGASPPRVPEHGEIVKYQTGIAPRLGVVLGSNPHHPTGNIKLAPLTSHSLHPPGPISARKDEVVTTLPGHVVRTGQWAPLLALNIDSHHEDHPPRFTHFAMGPVKGSPNYQDRRRLGGK